MKGEVQYALNTFWEGGGCGYSSMIPCCCRSAGSNGGPVLRRSHMHTRTHTYISHFPSVMSGYDFITASMLVGMHKNEHRALSEKRSHTSG